MSYKPGGQQEPRIGGENMAVETRKLWLAETWGPTNEVRRLVSIRDNGILWLVENIWLERQDDYDWRRPGDWPMTQWGATSCKFRDSGNLWLVGENIAVETNESYDWRSLGDWPMRKLKGQREPLIGWGGGGGGNSGSNTRRPAVAHAGGRETIFNVHSLKTKDKNAMRWHII